MHKNTAIKVQNLTKTYNLYTKPTDRLKESLHPLKKTLRKKYHKKFHALNNVSFDVKKGETLGIIGKNGSGKSTLLKIITGVVTPSGGRVIVSGKISAILELGAGFNPEMTGMENIYLNTSINGMNKAMTDKIIDDILAFAELGEFIHQPMKTYSSGMKARLAFAVSINVEPDILIIDEALSVGDAAFSRKCFAKIEEIRSKGATVLFVSHSEASIVSLCSRAVWLNSGEQIIDGIPNLVTGLYMKNLNQSRIDKKIIKHAYEKLKEGSQSSPGNSSLSSIDEFENSNIQNTPLDEFYNPALKSKSTICYDEKGAVISQVKVTTLDGKKVNVLNQENSYFIVLKCNIKETLNDVRIGIAIKDHKGVYYSGAAFEFLKHANIEKVGIGNYKVVMNFKCLLVEGFFIIDTVILKNATQSKEIAHRINDAYLFKVLKIEKNNIIESYVPMIKNFEVNEIN